MEKESVILKNSYQLELLPNQEQREVIKKRMIELVKTGKEYERIIFLDKSARPLSCLFIKLFKKLYPDLPLPQINFLNIGQEKTNRFYMDAFKKPLIHPNEIFSQLTTVEDLKKMFGIINIDVLIYFYKKGKSGKTLVVDTIEETGDTKTLTEKILKIIDPANPHDFFVLLSSEKDRIPFLSSNGDIKLPWKRISIIDDNPENPNSFFCVPAFYTFDRIEGLKLIKELKTLANEII